MFETGIPRLLMHKHCTNERTDSSVLIQNGANLFCSDMFDILDSYCELAHAHS